MIRFCCDTNVLIAACVPWHVHHARSRLEIDRRREAGEELVLAAHSLVEMYSVLTRIPERRIPPADVMTLIRANFQDAPVVPLPATDVWKALDIAEQQGVQGGRIYDALIVRCAIHAEAATFVTWNLRHFAAFGAEIRVVRPSRQ